MAIHDDDEMKSPSPSPSVERRKTPANNVGLRSHVLPEPHRMCVIPDLLLSQENQPPGLHEMPRR
jgi:hypothetical protein